MDTHDFPRFGRFTLRIPALNLILLIIGVFFFFQVLLDRTVNEWTSGPGFAGSDISGLTCWALGSSNVHGFVAGELWRLFACVFLHAGLVHFVVNAFSLWQLGRAVQGLFGGTRLLGVFLATGLAAALVSNAWYALRGLEVPSVGASGAVCGLMGLLLAHMRRRTDIVAYHVGRQLIGWAIVNAVIGILVPQINNAAHAGGFAAGYALDWLIEGPHARKVAKHTIAVCAILSLLCLSALVWAGLGAQDRSRDARATAELIEQLETTLNTPATPDELRRLTNALLESTRATTFAAEGAATAEAFVAGKPTGARLAALQQLYLTVRQDCGGMPVLKNDH